MSGEWDGLAQAAAGALVTALASDSGDEAERWFAGVIGQQRRLSATRAELAAAVGPGREQVMQSAITAWTYRLRDILEENPADVTYNSAGQPTGPMSDGNLVLQKEQGTIDGLVRLSGTIGGQTVTATINLTNAGVINPPPGVKPYNREAGTITVS